MMMMMMMMMTTTTTIAMTMTKRYIDLFGGSLPPLHIIVAVF